VKMRSWIRPRGKKENSTMIEKGYAHLKMTGEGGVGKDPPEKKTGQWDPVTDELTSAKREEMDLLAKGTTHAGQKDSARK